MLFDGTLVSDFNFVHERKALAIREKIVEPIGGRLSWMAV